jgi:acetolactate decarboxylase
MKKAIDHRLPSQKGIYAIRLKGNFLEIKVRSVPKQKTPYPPLAEVLKTQPTFDLAQVKGQLIGFWFPSSAAGINAEGFHFHFLSADHKAGGHLLGCSLASATVDIDDIHELRLRLP